MRASSRRRKRVLWNRSPSTSTTTWVPGKWTVPTVLRSFAARVPTRHPRLRRMSRRCWRRATWTRELRVSPSQCETAASDCAGGGDRTEPCARTSGEPYLCRTIALDHDLLSHHPVSCLRSPAGLSFPRRLGRGRIRRKLGIPEYQSPVLPRLGRKREWPPVTSRGSRGRPTPGYAGVANAISLALWTTSIRLARPRPSSPFASLERERTTACDRRPLRAGVMMPSAGCRRGGGPRRSGPRRAVQRQLLLRAGVVRRRLQATVAWFVRASLAARVPRRGGLS